MKKIVIIDDEPLARLIVTEYLQEHPEMEIVAECNDGFEGVKAINQHKPDLVFLDIQMPKINGFEMLELLESMPSVVFTTAFDEYAIKAFEANAVDYLLKPFTQARFDAALERARRLLGQAQPGLDRLVAPQPLARVLVRDGAGMQVLAVDAIDYVEAQADYVAFHSAGREHLKAQRISELEAQLDPARFVRVHRSFIINLASLQGLEKTDSDAYVARMKNGKRIPVSRSGYDKLRSVL